MAILTERFIRKPIYVEAIKVEPENLVEVARWCQGEIRDKGNDEIVPLGADVTDVSSYYIRVRVHNPRSPKQAQASVGDWILYTDRGYKVYTEQAFKGAFDPA